MYISKLLRKIDYRIIQIQHDISSFLGNMSLKRRLLCTFSMIAVVPLCTAAFFSAIVFRNGMKKSLIQSSNNTIYLMSVSMNQLLENIEESVIQIISMPAVTSYLQEPESDFTALYHQRKNLEENYMKPILGAARYINSIEIESTVNGNDSSFGYNRTVENRLSNREYPKQETDGSSRYQKWFYILDSAPEKEMTAIVYRRKIYEFGTGKQLGVIYVDITGESFLNEMLHEFNYLGNAEIQLVDQNGEVIVGDGKYASNQVMSHVYQKNFLDESGIITERIEGKKYILNYSKLINGWKIVHITPYDEIFHSTDSIFRIVLVLFVVLAGVILFLALTISRGITRPLEQLEHSMEAVKQGDFSKQVPVASQDEVGKLCEGFNLMIWKINHLFMDFKKEQKRKNEAELHNLQSQISPHFLYNILNSLRCDALIQGLEEYANIIGSLISLLKKSLDYTREYVTLEEEAELLEDYLALQSFRYRNKITYSIDISDGAKSCHSLKLILQPVVENCILHGMEDAPLKIRIHIWRDNHEIRVRVIDNGKGISAERIEQIQAGLKNDKEETEEHIGLRNIDRRLKLHFGESYGVSIFMSEEGTVVELRFAAVPFENSMANREGEI